ncbi:MAG: tRNA (adenosine(37)-N6)-threonylcarbamoyltransferase complex ATPase subunit type 1 TsaE [Balneolaceae bacterium]|nr:tRNA (adenosine(37)-N6)-threonylcarbamoyltransferase complex ATPase subunit type 1 TsaE [Balneolaceae bacterium]
MDKEFTTHSEKETIELGIKLAEQFNAGDILCLEGRLGAGKTHFVKGLAKGMGIDEKQVHSPTYTLIHEYLGGEKPLYHFDCYRMESEQEALEIGAEEYFYGSGVSVVEWPNRIRALIPDDAVWIQIGIENPTTRKFVISDNR